MEKQYCDAAVYSRPSRPQQGDCSKESKMRRAEGLGQPSGELPEPGRKAGRWESQGEIVSEGGESGHQWLTLTRGQGGGLRKVHGV